MKDKTFYFLYNFFGVYKTRVRIGLILMTIYIISIVLLCLKISMTFAAITTVLFIIENIAMIIYDGEEFERKHRRFK